MAAMPPPRRFADAVLTCLIAVLSTIAFPVAARTTPPPEPSEPLAFVARNPDGSIGRPVDAANPLVQRGWAVVPEIVALAKKPHRPVTMPLADRRDLTFRVETFEAREGIDVDDETGQIIVSGDPNDLSYYWHGTRGADHLALTVVRGQVEGRLYTPQQRYLLTNPGPGQQYQQIDMPMLNRGVCRNAEIMRELAGLQRAGAPMSQNTAALTDGERHPPAATDRAVKQIIASRNRRKNPIEAQDPQTDADPKYTVWLNVMFYFTDTLAEAIDDDTDPLRNYTPGNIAVAETLLTPRTQSYIDEINQSLLNTGGLSHIRVARVGPVVRLLLSNGLPYLESAVASFGPGVRFSSHLGTLQGYENDWIALSSGPPGPRRADHAADVALLLVEDMGDPGATPPVPLFGAAITQRPGCGFWGSFTCAPGQGLGTNSFGLFAYGLVSAAPATANFTFSHEIGHLLGADHDIPNTNPSVFPSFAHSFGHRVNGARDIMADPWCSVWLLDTCPRTQQYSNPERNFLIFGLPAGTPGGRTCANPSTCTYTEFAALTLRKMAQGTANIYPVGSDQSEPDIFWDSLEFFCEPPLCPVW